MADVQIIENTLETWLTRKQSELPALEERLIEIMGKALAKDTKPYVPRERGYLESSAESVWFLEPALHYWGLEIVWTGMLNPHRDGIHKDFIGANGELLDYALFQYFSPLRHEKLGATDHWVDYGMKDFVAENYGQIDKHFMEWLFK